MLAVGIARNDTKTFRIGIEIMIEGCFAGSAFTTIDGMPQNCYILIPRKLIE